jgi:hypothetical protein
VPLNAEDGLISLAKPIIVVGIAAINPSTAPLQHQDHKARSLSLLV